MRASIVSTSERFLITYIMILELNNTFIKASHYLVFDMNSKSTIIWVETPETRQF